MAPLIRALIFMAAITGTAGLAEARGGRECRGATCDLAPFMFLAIVLVFIAHHYLVTWRPSLKLDGGNRHGCLIVSAYIIFVLMFPYLAFAIARWAWRALT